MTLMILPDEDLPDRPQKRFLVGFCAAAIVTFVGIVLYSSKRLREAAPEAAVAAAVVGLIAGILSAFGKKLLRLVLTFLSQIISNP